MPFSCHCNALFAFLCLSDVGDVFLCRYNRARSNHYRDSEKNYEIMIDELIEELTIDEDLAIILLNEGFTSLEEVAYVPLQEMLDIEDDMLTTLKSLDYEGFIRLGMEYSDAVIKANEGIDKSLQLLIDDIKQSKKVDTIEKSDNFTDSYLELYNELVG